jgi:nitrate reductase NapE component
LAANDPRLWPATVAATVAVVAIVLWPERAVTISGIAGFVMLSDIAWRWRQSPPSTPSSSSSSS